MIATKNRKEKMLQVPIDEELHKKLKLKCLTMDSTMAIEIERLVREFVKGKVHAG